MSGPAGHPQEHEGYLSSADAAPQTGAAPSLSKKVISTELSEVSQAQKTNSVRFHSEEESRKSNLERQTVEGWLPEAEGPRELVFSASVSVWGDGKFWRWAVVMVAQQYECA